MQNAVGVDIEGHFDLRNATRRGRDAIKMECPEIFVIARKRTFALQYLDLHARLVVAIGRKDLRLASRDGGVARNHRRSYAACGFNLQRERRHAEEEQALYV